MARKSRMQSAREAKDRRMKFIAAGGAALLAVVLAFEVPHMLSKGKSSSPATPAATTPATATTPTGTAAAAPATTPPGTAAAAVAPTSTKLADSDVAPRHSKSQLYSFSHFAGKDPFVQQVSQGTALPTPPASTATPAPSPTAVTAASVHSGTGSQAASASRTLAQAGSATIAINGQPETLRAGARFPSSNPLFRLVSISRGVARIGIANGSYASGAHTISVTAGRTVTLVDQADGARYTLRLLRTS